MRMLLETERANAARDKKKAELPQVTPPTLKELGLTKRESAEAQLLMETERAKGAQGTGNNQFKKVVQSPDVTAPTLAQLGLTYRESADAHAHGDGTGEAA